MSNIYTSQAARRAR